MENVQKSFSISNIFEKVISFFKTNKQNLLNILLLVSAILLFIYSLGFSTGWAIGNQIGGRIGDLVIKEATPANKLMLILSFLVLVSVIISMLLGTHKRKKFSIANYVAISITSLLLITTIIVYFVKISQLSKEFELLLNDPSLSEDWKTLFMINFAKPEDIRLIFSLGIYIIAISSLGFIGNIYTIVDKILYAKESRETYTSMMNKIQSGDVTLIDSRKKSNNNDDESITINVDKETEIMDMKVDKMRYQNNGVSYGLILLSILFVLIAGFMTITFNSFTNDSSQIKVVPNLNIALDIVMIILTLLLSFLGAEKVKFYKIKWTYGMMIISVVTIARIFYIPLQVLGKDELPAGRFSVIVILMCIAAGLQIAGAVIGYIKSKKLENHLKKMGEK
ncbi:hypothetical protein BN85405160 [Alteracholeplasma palmae J233]|uniref:Uncharacterized protein n=1 Tax=Alteracholeplasma palmae (strain ATCC 49389 / J233) TaxID=1318466 RepID=U4KKI4_ALTPJ|nr:hypothetical protein [Alteracholeplasma palmae]CCV64093.1 hypothetical protein BN85405160 [Alteracholeplasma palmae J233]